jgi:1,2-phenylacetyl-CoA epoxidase catalytic subunit
MDDELEPHSLGDEEFDDETHSFDFWFGAVEGYLTDRPYGHLAATADTLLDSSVFDDRERDRLITTLCNYCTGETAALEGASGLVRLAPNHNSKIFMATQVVDEARHLEVFLRRLADLGVDDPEAEIEKRANPALLEFKDALLDLVDNDDWSSAVFAQNVILETMEYTVFRAHAENADPVTAEVLRGVISDERRHLGFGETHIGRGLGDGSADRARLQELRGHFESLVLRVFEDALDDVAIPRDERPELGRDYLQTIERLGMAL